MGGETIFDGKVALIVGATSGMGAATARAFAVGGARVMVCGRRAPEGDAVVAQIIAAGGQATFAAVDVTDESSIIVMLEATHASYGRLDFAVNNAAKEIPAGPLAERSAADCDALMAVNLRGVFLCMKYQILSMLRQGGGAIVNITSGGAHVGIPNAALYTASKHAVLGLTKAAALEYVKSGIRINAVSPGIVDTEMLRRYVSGAGYSVAQMAAGTPIGRPADPDEIASATLWLCSPTASFVIGQAIVVDGGQTAQ
jgi:NAD(P)-dependent dehydrogenase (short-subunit alcohol dehydrogenase family)